MQTQPKAVKKINKEPYSYDSDQGQIHGRSKAKSSN